MQVLNLKMPIVRPITRSVLDTILLVLFYRPGHLDELAQSTVIRLSMRTYEVWYLHTQRELCMYIYLGWDIFFSFSDDYVIEEVQVQPSNLLVHKKIKKQIDNSLLLYGTYLLPKVLQILGKFPRAGDRAVSTAQIVSLSWPKRWSPCALYIVSAGPNPLKLQATVVLP